MPLHLRDHRDFLVNHSPSLMLRAKRLADMGEGVACTVMAVAAITALPADLLNYLLYARGLPFKGPNITSQIRPGLTSAEIRLAACLTWLEHRRKPLIHSLKAIHEAWGAIWDPEHPIIKDFGLLTQVRNELVHPKEEMITIQLRKHLTRGNPSGYPKVAARLVEKKLIKRLDGSVSWLEALDSPAQPTDANDHSTQPSETASPYINWAMSTALRMVDLTLQNLPNCDPIDQNSQRQISIIRAFRQHAYSGL